MRALREGSAAEQAHHLDGGEGGLATLVRLVGRRALERLVERVGREDTEDHGDTGVELHALDPRRTLPCDEVVVARLPADDSAQAQDRVDLPGECEAAGHQRQLERPRRPRDRDVAAIGARLEERVERAVEETQRDAAVEQGARGAHPQPDPVVLAAQRRAHPCRDVVEGSLGQGDDVRAGHQVVRREVVRVTPSLCHRTSSRPCRRWPMRSRFVRRYAMFSGLADVCRGTRSVMSRPKPSRPPYLTGLLVMRRMVVTPRSTSIWAPMPYSRLSTGRPCCRLASTVSCPSSCNWYARILWPRPMPRPSCPRR